MAEPVPAPAPARQLSAALTLAVTAARVQDPEGFEIGTAALAALDQAVLRPVLGDLVRRLLEEKHAGGLSGEDAQELLERVVRSALAWLPDVEVPALIVVLTGALGMQDPDDEPDLAPALVASHAVLLVEELLEDRPLEGPLELAIGELRRHQTIELP
jgi:hypothetical protein